MSTSCIREFTLNLNAGFHGYWKCDDTVDPVVDQTGFNDLTSTGSIVSVAGIQGTAFDIEHWEAEVSGTDRYKFLAHDFMIRFWVKMDYDPGILGASQFPALRNHASDWSWELYMTTDNAHKGPNWTVYNTVGTAFLINSNTLLTSGWHRIVAWVKTGVEIGMKIDNDADVTLPFATTIYNPSTANAGLFVANGTSGWHDVIDEIAIWNRVLSAAELLTDWNSGNGTTYPTI